jgi:hypothetical protein
MSALQTDVVSEVKLLPALVAHEAAGPSPIDGETVDEHQAGLGKLSVDLNHGWYGDDEK